MLVTLEINDADIQLALNHGFEHAVWIRSGNVNAVEPWVRPRDGDYKPTAEDLKEANIWGDTDRIWLNVMRGLRMMYTPPKQNNSHTNAIGVGERPSLWDAHQANCFLQYCAFGKLVYE